MMHAATLPISSNVAELEHCTVPLPFPKRTPKAPVGGERETEEKRGRPNTIITITRLCSVIPQHPPSRERRLLGNAFFCAYQSSA